MALIVCVCVCDFVLAVSHTSGHFELHSGEKERTDQLALPWSQSRATRSPLAIGRYFGRRLFGPLR